MIISASRRTDIPNYYSEWFFNRIREGFVFVRNPMNPRQVSKISLSPEVVDCIIFWTKNPEPMLERLDELQVFPCCFQFTLTGYGRDVEENVPHKKEKMIPVFQKLSDKLGRGKVIWRYDPILFTDKYTPEYHLKAFGQIAGSLKGYTNKCVISFVDSYAKNRKALSALKVYEPDELCLRESVRQISRMAAENGMSVVSCAEKLDLRQWGIEHGSCIDKRLIEEITGCSINGVKDTNQRAECGCMESVDIGAYDTCQNGCKYCYANQSREKVLENCGRYDSRAPLLCGTVREEDRVSERRMKSLKEGQIKFQ